MLVSNKLSILKTNQQSMIEEAKALLHKAVEKEFETVFIVGIKDKKMCINYSRSLNVVEKIGMLEILKHDWISNWE